MAEIQTPDVRENSAYSDDGRIGMDAARSRRFWLQMRSLDDAIKSLAGVARMFPQQNFEEGEIHPETMVIAMTNLMQSVSDQCFSMLNGLDLSKEPQEDSDA